MNREESHVDTGIVEPITQNIAKISICYIFSSVIRLIKANRRHPYGTAAYRRLDTGGPLYQALIELGDR